uniref:DNA topoisomerase 2 n=1 Tax=Tetrahymena thermophila TaxID=5911 RepID=Q6PUA3_TETTH|nr:DNA topoisomerase type 2 [Tetrahymena thermophila]
MSVETTYQKKTQLEHILLRPDTYVGSNEYQDEQMWVLADDGSSFENRQIKYVPALYKIFDEILVNAADNYQRDKRMKRLDVIIDQKNNCISILNDGKGIPVQIHKEYNIYVPELIFGHLLTSSNYNDEEKKVVGGRNGFGAKLTNIFSTKFIVESADSKNKKKFQMTWTKNMSEQSEPQISSYTESDYTKITFYPDLKKFHMKELEKDIVDLMKKRVYDMAGVIGGSVKVSLNGERISISSFSDYCDFYLKNQGAEVIKVSDNKGTNNQRWEVIASLSEGQFQQVSFVNSICTSKGGTHVNYITDQITEKLMETLKKKEKSLNIKQFQVKSHLWIFVNCLIENPSFDTQTKETLTLRQQSFGSTCEVSEKFIKELLKSNIINHILLQARAKEQAKMAKTLSAKKQSRLLGVPKLEDANDAGTRNAESCTLIITEGDSAKALAMSGIEVVGRDKFGVFPLKGKMLNVRDSTSKQITENLEIQNIIKVMGMKLNTNYDNVKSLRYGSIMIMADQDHDGSHIKGLFINFIQNFWPSLFQMDGFLKEFITPIVKVRKGNQSISFFSIQDFKRWKSTCPNQHLWKIKYYKGLGTSTDQEAQEYFGNINKHVISFKYNGKDDEDAIDLAFNKKRAEDRKKWLVKYDPEENVDHSQKHLTYKDFVNKELINFSNSDNARSIPSLCDGLKPGQRKILFACFKRNLKNEIKVAQLSGYVAEHSAYHHGEQSLESTIVGMAQSFVGTNNINYLMPIGQFGSRNMGGKEAASARYIHTCLNKITRCVFPEPDDHILYYLEDEGQQVEPIYYLPIIPTALLNGADGIGTGWSTSIPCYNPRELVDSIEKRMMGVPFTDLLPWYKGFTGEISNNEKSQITVSGKYHLVNETTIEITELPIKKWIRDYKNFLEEKLESTKDKDPEIEDIKEYHAGNRVHFVVKMSEKQMEKVQREGIDKYFKLQSTIPTTNMVLFNHEGKLTRYANICEIMEEFYEVRLNAYKRRKEYLVSKIERDLEILSNKKRFILAVINESIRVRNAKRKDLIKELSVQGYVQMKDMPKIKSSKLTSQLEQEQNQDSNEENFETNPNEINAKEYNYLLSLPMWSLTYEKVEEIKQEQKNKQDELDKLVATEVIDIWKEDLKNFIECLDQIEEEEDEEMRKRMKKQSNSKVKQGSTASSKLKKKPTKKKQDSDDDDDDAMDIEEDGDGSDFDTGKKKQKKKPSSAPSSQAGPKGKIGDYKPNLSQDTGISSKTNKNNQNTLGFIKQQAPITTQVKTQPEVKKPVDPLLETLEKYTFKKENTQTQKEEDNTQNSVISQILSQNYSLSLEERLKLRAGENSQNLTQQTNGFSQQVNTQQDYNNLGNKDEEEEDDLLFNFKKEKKEKQSTDIFDELDDLDALFNEKRQGADLENEEEQLTKKRVLNEGEPKSIAQNKKQTKEINDEDLEYNLFKDEKPKQKKPPATAASKSKKVINKNEDDDEDFNDDLSEDEKPKKKRSNQTQSKTKKQKNESEDEDFNSKESDEKPKQRKSNSNSQKARKPKKMSDDEGEEDDDFIIPDEDPDEEKPKKRKSNATKPKNNKEDKDNQKSKKNRTDSPKLKITNSEDEDVAELKQNEVLQTRTRGKRNPIPRKMIIDNSDEDFSEEEEFGNSKKKSVNSKSQKKQKDDESSDECYF